MPCDTDFLNEFFNYTKDNKLNPSSFNGRCAGLFIICVNQVDLKKGPC